MPFIHGKPPYYVPADIDVEPDVGPVGDFIAETNCAVLHGHCVTTLGRTISEAYHRLNSFASEVRRNIIAEHLAAIKGSSIRHRSQDEIDLRHRFAEQVTYPDRAEAVMSARGC